MRMLGRFHRIASYFAVLVFVGGCAQSPSPSPFRDSDSTLVEVCFDSMGRDAPARLVGEETTDFGLTTARLELIGFTMSDRPIYQGRLAHPRDFRALFLELPASSVIARIDRPDSLPKSIEVWRNAPAPTVCTMSPHAAMYVVNGRPLPEPIACPDVKMSVRFTVGSGAAFSNRRNLDRQRPPALFNGLRGCNESIYGLPARTGAAMVPNPSIERTATSGLRPLASAAHVER